MIGFVALADIPLGTDLLRDVVVHQSDAYIFAPPKYVARFVKEAAFTGSRLVFRTAAPPALLSDPGFETGLHVWDGKVQTLRIFKDGTDIVLEPLGLQGEAISALILPRTAREEPSSLEVFRFNQAQTSHWKMPLGYGSSGHRAYDFGHLELNWFPKIPVDMEGYEKARQAVIGLTGEPILLPEGFKVEGEVDGQYIAATPNRDRYCLYRNGQWEAMPREEIDKIFVKHFEARNKRRNEAAPPPLPYAFNRVTAIDRKTVPATSRKELWVVTTDQFGPNRILASAQASWSVPTLSRLAYIEKGNLFVREISKMPRNKYEALAAKAEEADTRKGLAMIAIFLAAKTHKIEANAAALQGYKANSRIAALNEKAFADLDPKTEIGRFEGRYGYRIVRKDLTSEWVSRPR